MADNSTADPGAGGDTFRLKDRAGVKTQIVGIDLAPGGAETLMNGVMPVSDNGGSLTVDGTVTATGPLTDAQLRASAVPVSGTVTVDTEFPAAAALADATANPTTSAIASMLECYNGATWDRLRGDITNGLDVDVTRVSGTVTIAGAVTNAGTFAVQDSQKVVDNAAFADGSTPVNPVGFVFDEVAGTALTENDAAAARIDAKRAQIGVLEDATTRGQRAAVSAGGALKVDGSAATQPVSGTVTANAGTGPFPVSDNAGSLTVDAPVGTPVFVRLSDGTTAIATLPVSLASLPTLAAGTNNIGDVDVLTLPALVAGTAQIGTVSLTPGTTGGLTTFHLISAATTNATNVKASAGQLFGWYIRNTSAGDRKVAFHNTAGAPTAGAGVIFSLNIPAGAAANVFGDVGVPFATGIAITTVTDIADAGTTAVALNDLDINLFYK